MKRIVSPRNAMSCISRFSAGEPGSTNGKPQPHRAQRLDRALTSARLSEGSDITVKVSDQSQPPLTLDLSLSEPAGSGSLHRLVCA